MYVLGSIWAVLAVTLLLFLVTRQFRPRGMALLAGSGAWGLAAAAQRDPRGRHTITGLGVNVRIGDGPAYPVANVAAVTALVSGIVADVVRPLRRILAVVILLVCAAAMYLGAGFPADVLGGLLVGFGIAASVRVVFGAPGGQPSIDEVRTAAHRSSVMTSRRLHGPTSRSRARRSWTCQLTSDERLRVDVFGRDQRDARIAAWRPALRDVLRSRTSRCSAAGSSRSSTSATR